MKNLKLLSKIALSFKDLTKFDQDMKAILSEIGDFIGVSRIYIFFNETKEVVSNTFEWCNEGIVSQIQNLQNFKYKDAPSWNHLLTSDSHIISNDIDDLPQDIIDILEPQQIKSIVVYPLIIENEIRGFIGCDECKYKRTWTAEELEIMSTVSGIVANAYERKYSRQEVVDSVNNFCNLFETMDDMLIISDLEGNIIHSNRSLTDKLGYSPLELQNMSILDLHPLELREKAANIVEKMLKGESKHCSLEVEGKWGQIYFVETRIWFGKWNKKNCIYSISKDVTKENENLELFSKIFKNNPLPMAITSINEMKFININPMFSEKTGYSKEELLGKTIGELNIINNIGHLKAIRNKRAQQEIIKDEEIILRCKDGRLLNVVFSEEEINHQGKKSLLTVIVDITERVELTKNVEDKCEKLTNIIESTNLGTWEWNVQTGEIAINEQWARLIGYSLDELQPLSIETWNKLSHPEDLKVSDEIIEKHLKGEQKFYDCEVRMKHKDGRWIWIQDRGKVTERDRAGRPVKMFGTHSDITLRKQAEEDLKESEKRFFLALDETKAGLWDFDMVNNEMFFSSMWKKILGYSENEIEDSFKTWQELWHPEDKDKIQKALDDYLEGKSKRYEIIHRLKHKDGSWRWILSRGGILRDDKGLAYRAIGTHLDITKEQKQAVELDRFFSINLDLLCITDTDGNFLKTNKAWEDILGYPSSKLQKRKFFDFIHPDDVNWTVEVIELLKTNKRVSHFINRYISIDGNYRYMEWKANLYENIVYSAARDITERIEYENKLLEISNRDSLTNIYNRRYVYNRAEAIIEEYKRTGKRFSVCILDIDYFKRVNDNYGHQIGDCVLKEFTRIIRENIRSYDILGRYGGEEFIIILNNVDAQGNSQVIERLLNIIRNKTFIINGESINITFSAGISDCNEIEKDEMLIDNLIEIADRRMYQAKNTGRNKIVSKLDRSYT